jgi:arsenate reductase
LAATLYTEAEVTNVLFLCIGNSCRSQMAEGFARTYGSDVMVPFSAGLSPAPIIQPLTKQVMLAKNISIGDQYPKDVAELLTQDFSMIINITGRTLPIRAATEVREWAVEDPIGQSEEIYIKVRDQLEALVMKLILDLRRRFPKEQAPQLATRAARFGFGRVRPARD